MRLYCAPMEGITSYLYRQAHHRWFGGVERYYLPFLSPSQNHVFTRRELQEIRPEHNQGLEAAPQLLTRRAEDFLWAAGALADLGYGEVNLNLGCPSGTVAAKGKGAGFLASPGELERFLDAIFAAPPLAVSIKTRLGVAEEGEFPTLLALFQRYPVKELTIHPRVQRDMYRHPVRRGAFAAALPACTLPVCYNGDLATAADCAAFAAEFPEVGAAMLGRGLIGDPALARKAAGGPAANREELRAFHDGLYEGYCAAFGSRRNAMLRMKEIWFYLIGLFDGAGPFEKALRKAADPRAYESQVSRLFGECPLRTDNPARWLA